MIYTLTYKDGTSVETTWNHPFYIKNRGWVEVKDLKVGDKSYTSNTVSSSKISENRVLVSQAAGLTVAEKDGNYLEIASISQNNRDEKVYNIEVENDHTYFVTESEVLVHNYLGTALTAISLGIGIHDFKEAYDNGDKLGMVLSGAGIVADTVGLITGVPGGAGIARQALKEGAEQGAKQLLKEGAEQGVEKFAREGAKQGVKHSDYAANKLKILNNNKQNGIKAEDKVRNELNSTLKSDEKLLEKATFKTQNGVRSKPDFVIVNEKTKEIVKIREVKSGNAQLSNGQKALEKEGGTLVGGKKFKEYNGIEATPGKLKVKRVPNEN